LQTLVLAPASEAPNQPEQPHSRTPAQPHTRTPAHQSSKKARSWVAAAPFSHQRI